MLHRSNDPRGSRQGRGIFAFFDDFQTNFWLRPGKT